MMALLMQFQDQPTNPAANRRRSGSDYDPNRTIYYQEPELPPICPPPPFICTLWPDTYAEIYASPVVDYPV